MRTHVLQVSLIPILAATCMISACATAAQTPAPVAGSLQGADVRAMAAAFDAYLDAAVEHDHFSGMVLVARNGVPIFSQSYGMANYELNAPFTPDTVFNVASITKQFTATAILQLQEQGRLNVNDPICTYLDDCPSAWRPITIRHLLTHTSGIPNYSSLPDWDEVGAVTEYHSHLEVVALFRDLPLEFAPGAQHSYSNSGYQLLGLIIERTSGVTYGAYLNDHIFAPLGMTHTRYNNRRTLIPNRATGYYSLGTSFINASLHSPTIHFGDAGVFTSAGDLLIWDQALYSDRVLSQDSMHAMFTPYLDNYAYGWRVGESFGHRQTNHSGSSQGFSTNITRFPDDRLTVIVLSNSDSANATRVSQALSAISLGAPYQLPASSLHDVLWNVIAEDGVAAGKQRYLELERAQPSADTFAEDEALVELGYSLYEADKLVEAQQIFEFGLEKFPRSAYSYDGLADIAASRGDYQTAVRHFETSLNIDPTNDYAIRGLARVRRSLD
jgi:CubicO group peptidase (beta-lactamase class C family)